MACAAYISYLRVLERVGVFPNGTVPTFFEWAGGLVGVGAVDGSGFAGEVGDAQGVVCANGAGDCVVESALGGVDDYGGVGVGHCGVGAARRSVDVDVGDGSGCGSQRFVAVAEVMGQERGKHFKKNAAKRARRDAAVRAERGVPTRAGSVGTGLRCGDCGKFACVRAGVAGERYVGPCALVGRRSAFEGCDPEKVRKLKETRLDALVAKNEWDAQRFARKSWRADAYLTGESRRITRSDMETEAALLKLAKARGVEGWAETVLSASTESKRSVHSEWRASRAKSVSADSSVSVEAYEDKVLGLQRRLDELEFKAGGGVLPVGSGCVDPEESVAYEDAEYEPGPFGSW